MLRLVLPGAGVVVDSVSVRLESDVSEVFVVEMAAVAWLVLMRCLQIFSIRFKSLEEILVVSILDDKMSVQSTWVC